ncbi:MAG: hypothetical protein MK076_11235 [Flavobacteriales bacterium]|nr:hypothetical protein [Flavobacteriales bacterium]
MKKALLVFVAMFTCVAYAEVEISSHTSGVIGFGNPRSEAVSFYERGIQFHVYLNGDFDFDSRYLRARRNWRVPVSRDYRGRINRIGNVWVRYDSWGNVRRIGRVSMSYRRGWLQRVGNLRIQYNRWGIPNFYGSVGFDDFYNGFYYRPNNGVRFNWSAAAICVYNDPFFYGNQFRNNYRRVREDANYIYYKANDGAHVSRNRMIRRRKPSNGNTSSQISRDRSNNGTSTTPTVRNQREQTNVESSDTSRRNTVERVPRSPRRNTQVSSNRNSGRSTVRRSGDSNQRRTQTPPKKVRKRKATTKKSSRSARGRGASS